MMTIYGFGTIRSQMTGPAARKRPCAATARGKHLLCTGGNRRSAATARAKTLSRAGRSNCSAGRVRQGICAVWPMRGPRVHPGLGSKASPILFPASHGPTSSCTCANSPPPPGEDICFARAGGNRRSAGAKKHRTASALSDHYTGWIAASARCPISARRCSPSNAMPSAALYAAASAAGRSSAMAVTPSTRPPAVTSAPSPASAVPAWYTVAPP